MTTPVLKGASAQTYGSQNENGALAPNPCFAAGDRPARTNLNKFIFAGRPQAVAGGSGKRYERNGSYNYVNVKNG
jgi:hypothetical protein